MTRTPLVLGLAALVLALPACRSRCRPCCPRPAPTAVREVAVPAQPAPSGGAALQAAFNYAEGKAAAAMHDSKSAIAAYEMALYQMGLRILGSAPMPATAAALRAKISADLETARAVPGEKPPATEGADLRLVVQIHSVADLVAMWPRLPWPHVQIVGPEGVHEETQPARDDPTGTLISLLKEAIKADWNTAETPQGKADIKAQGGTTLVVKATIRAEDAVNAYLTTLRESISVLEPEAAAGIVEPKIQLVGPDR